MFKFWKHYRKRIWIIVIPRALFGFIGLRSTSIVAEKVLICRSYDHKFLSILPTTSKDPIGQENCFFVYPLPGSSFSTCWVGGNHVIWCQESDMNHQPNKQDFFRLVLKLAVAGQTHTYKICTDVQTVAKIQIQN